MRLTRVSAMKIIRRLRRFPQIQKIGYRESAEIGDICGQMSCSLGCDHGLGHQPARNWKIGTFVGQRPH